MPQFTSRHAIPFLTIIERPSIHGITGQMAAAIEAALNTVSGRAEAGNTAAANAQARADSAYAGFVARHRQTASQALQSGTDFTRLSIDDRQFGWPLSQGSGQPTRIYIRRDGVYLVGGAVDFLPPASGAAPAGRREVVLGVNGSPTAQQTPSTAIFRSERDCYVKLGADLVSLKNGDYIEIMGRHSQGAAIEYRANLWAQFAGNLPA